MHKGVTQMLKPLGDHVLVRPSEAEERTRGGIVLPDAAQKKPMEGEVLAVGSGKLLDSGKRVPTSVKVGDIVVYSKYAGTEVTVKDEKLMILEEDTILAVRE